MIAKILAPNSGNPKLYNKKNVAKHINAPTIGRRKALNKTENIYATYSKNLFIVKIGVKVL